MEQLLKSGESTDKTYAALLTKERQKLEDWRYDRDMEIVKVGGSEPEVVKMQQKLQSKLDPLLEKRKHGVPGICFNGLCADVIVAAEPVLTPTTNSSDASARAEKRALMTEEQIRDAVKCFASANTHLYNATA